MTTLNCTTDDPSRWSPCDKFLKYLIKFVLHIKKPNQTDLYRRVIIPIDVILPARRNKLKKFLSENITGGQSFSIVVALFKGKPKSTIVSIRLSIGKENIKKIEDI